MKIVNISSTGGLNETYTLVVIILLVTINLKINKVIGIFLKS